MGGDAIAVGILGYGWISRTHAHALHTLNHLQPLRKRIRLVSIAGRRDEPLAEAARELGFERSTTSWQELVEDPEIDVVANLFALGGHAEPTLAALAAGKHVLCEKPLGRDAAESRELWEAADRAGVTHAVGFNYRYLPAVALAKQVLDQGRLGELRHYRALYLQDYATAGGQERSSGGAGAVLDYSHLVDMLRFLVGEPETVDAITSGDDAYAALFRFADGLVAALEASRIATGWKGRHRFELNGSGGSLWWDMEDPNRLHVFLTGDEQDGLGGFRDVLVTQPEHPYLRQWWPPGHVLGWEHGFVHQWRDFLEAVLEGRPVPNRQASFEDGYRAAVLCDSVQAAAREGRRLAIAETAAAM